VDISQIENNIRAPLLQRMLLWNRDEQ